MSASSLRLLVCTNGSQPAQLGIEYALLLAQNLSLPIHLLGIDEKPERLGELQRTIADTVERMEAAHIPFTTEIVQGESETIIPQRAAEGTYISMVGRLARPIWRNWISGRSFRTLLAEIASPLIYVPRIHWPLRRMLICTGGLKYVFSLEHLAFHLAQRLGAEVTLLHIVQPVRMSYPLAQNVQEHWKSLLQTNTPQGKTLQTAVQEAQAAGLKAEVIVRRGNVVSEILQEANSGKYDLIGLGSPYSTHSLRHLYLPNVTAEVAEGVEIPVLTVRAGWAEAGTAPP